MSLQLPSAGSIATGKDLLSLLRDAILFVLALLLLCFPETFNNILIKAGFEEGSLIGMKWKKQILETNDELEIARKTIEDLKKQLDSSSRLLAFSQSKIQDTMLRRQINNLEARNTTLLKRSANVENSMAQTIKQNKPFVEKAEHTVGTATEWGIVYSGDKTLDEARYEAVNMAEKYALPNTAIYFREGSYRTVSVVSDRDEALKVLSRAKRRRSDAYLVRMEKWCPSHKEESGYFVCQ